MADDLQDLLGNVTMLTIKPNWGYMPRRDFRHNAEIYQYSESNMRIHDVSSDVAHIYKAMWTSLNKTEEWNILHFFTRRKGRLKKFWLPIWKNEFVLNTNISTWDNTIIIKDCFCADTFQGYERIFLELTNGDIITRHVTAVTDNGDDTETLTLETLMDRDITVDDISYFGRLIYTRFDQDELEVEHISSGASEADLTASFLEVTEEYTAVGAES